MNALIDIFLYFLLYFYPRKNRLCSNYFSARKVIKSRKFCDMKSIRQFVPDVPQRYHSYQTCSLLKPSYLNVKS